MVKTGTMPATQDLTTYYSLERAMWVTMEEGNVVNGDMALTSVTMVIKKSNIYAHVHSYICICTSHIFYSLLHIEN